ncbi:hypothetical protein D9M68_975470 [compost metagenome]
MFSGKIDPQLACTGLGKFTRQGLRQTLKFCKGLAFAKMSIGFFQPKFVKPPARKKIQCGVPVEIVVPEPSVEAEQAVLACCVAIMGALQAFAGST